MNERSGEASARRRAWRCRRGTKELDILLTRFVDRGFDELSDELQQVFDNSLLTTQDPQLDAWLMGKEVPEDEQLQRLVTLIRQHVHF